MDNLAQLILGAAVATIHVGVVGLDQVLVSRFDFCLCRGVRQAQYIQRFLLQRLNAALWLYRIFARLLRAPRIEVLRSLRTCFSEFLAVTRPRSIFVAPRKVGIGAGLPGWAVPVGRVLVVVGDFVIAHTIEVIVGCIVLAHMRFAEVEELPIAATAHRCFMRPGFGAPLELARRMLLRLRRGGFFAWLHADAVKVFGFKFHGA